MIEDLPDQVPNMSWRSAETKAWGLCAAIPAATGYFLVPRPSPPYPGPTWILVD